MRRVTATFDNQQKPQTSRILAWIARIYLWLAGWRLDGPFPGYDKMLLIASPHTSNWDGWNLIMGSWVARVPLKWMVKEEAIKGPFGWFVTATGGVPINRRTSVNMVDQAAQKLKEADRMILLVAPEGTRRKSDHWKTGFYWIAHNAGVPLVAARMDYKRKVMDFIGPFETTGDIEADIQPIWETYSEVTALHPEKVSDHYLRPSSIKRGKKATAPEQDTVQTEEE